jgi:hypothetical protein
VSQRLSFRTPGKARREKARVANRNLVAFGRCSRARTNGDKNCPIPVSAMRNRRTHRTEPAVTRVTDGEARGTDASGGKVAMRAKLTITAFRAAALALLASGRARRRRRASTLRQVSRPSTKAGQVQEKEVRLDLDQVDRVNLLKERPCPGGRWNSSRHCNCGLGGGAARLMQAVSIDGLAFRRMAAGAPSLCWRRPVCCTGRSPRRPQARHESCER